MMLTKLNKNQKTHGVCKLVLHNLSQIVPGGVESSLLSGAQDPEDVLGRVEVDQHCEAVVGFLQYVLL